MFGLLKKLVLTSVALFMAGGVYVSQDEPSQEAIKAQLLDITARLIVLKENVLENPAPYLTAVGTFMIMFVFNKFKGLSTRDSALSAATRLTVVTTPPAPTPPQESPVVSRAKARATKKQMENDLNEIQNKIKTLPGKIKQAEQESAWATAELEKAQKAYASAKELADHAESEAAELRAELAKHEGEIEVINAELAAINKQAV